MSTELHKTYLQIITPWRENKTQNPRHYGYRDTGLSLRAWESAKTIVRFRELEESGKVLAVLQGHYHRNDHRRIGGIDYGTLAAMVEGSGKENNAYSIMEILPGDTIRIRGFRKQESYKWSRTTR